jgi:hypothetical protein
VRPADATRLSLFHRLGIVLVILGMMQSLAPGLLPRPTRSSLRLQGQLRFALASLASPVSVRPAGVVPRGPTPAAESRQDEESDQESQDTESPAETIAWPEALAERRAAERSFSMSPLCALPEPDRGAERSRFDLQRARALSLLSITSSSVTTRLCRFLC